MKINKKRKNKNETYLALFSVLRECCPKCNNKQASPATYSVWLCLCASGNSRQISARPILASTYTHIHTHAQSIRYKHAHDLYRHAQRDAELGHICPFPEGDVSGRLAEARL